MVINNLRASPMHHYRKMQYNVRRMSNGSWTWFVFESRLRGREETEDDARMRARQAIDAMRDDVENAAGSTKGQRIDG